MTLRDIRIEFVKRCGRYDLVSPTQDEQGSVDEWRDNGANFYIQSGQRYLDRQGDWDTGRIGAYFGALQAGQNTIIVEDCWAVQAVYWQISLWNKEHWEAIEAVHSPKALKCLCAGCPRYYFDPLLVLPTIDMKKASDAAISSAALDMSANQLTQAVRGAKLHFIGFPRYELIRIKVIGHFHSKELNKDEDSNFWTTQHPEILLKAAMYELEVFYRNSEGANDWLNALQIDLLDLQQTELLTSVMTQPAEMGV